jgi:cyclophilin family peptidyl-prolyl cis-trans isomerase
VGRLPYADSLAAAAAVRWLVGVAHGVADSRGAVEEQILGILHGLYTLARRQRGAVAADEGAVQLLRQVATHGRDLRGAPSGSWAQRLAWHTLSTLQIRGLDREALDAWERNDWQLRRSILLYLPLVRDSQSVRLLLDSARRDTAFQVRYEWVRAYKRLLAHRAGCEPILGALGDANPHVQLAAVDALDASCGGNEALARLRALAQETPAAGDRAPGRASWHLGARALLALARIEPNVSTAIVRRAATHPVWQVRMYAARAAEQARDTVTLSELARDRVGSVREAAVSGLARVAGHAADSIFVAALASPDYHVVLAGATGLRNSPRGSDYLEAALTALARLTREAKETSRDPRLALLERIGEWGGRRSTPLLRPYLADYDPEVAARAAAISRGWAPEPDAVEATPRPRPHVESTIASVALAGPVRLEVVMAPESGGGAFVLCLCRPALTPATVARILRLVRSGYYDGLTWHRVVTNFVIQGGSPGMNEYAGDGPFMRDEISEQMHLRGTVGISTRGRDTGDAQWFVNLVDNYRLDYEYTVFATVESGMDVVDGILEGDRILRVRVLPSGGDRNRGIR